MGGDADELEVAEVFDGEWRGRGGDGEDAAGGQVDRFETGAEEAAGAAGDKEVSHGRRRAGAEGVAGPVEGRVEALDAEVVFVEEQCAVREFDGGALAGAGGEAGRFEGLFDVEFAGATVVEDAVGNVAVLLGFKDDRAGPDGVDGAGIDEDHVLRGYGEGEEALLEGAVGDFGADLVEGGAGDQAAGNLRAGVGGEGIPALGFATGLAVLLRELVVGMDLDAELLLGKEDLDEKRGVRGVVIWAEEEGGELAKERGKGLAGKGAGGGETLVAGEPDFADGLAGACDVLEPGAKVAGTPDAGDKLWLDAERQELKGRV